MVRFVRLLRSKERHRAAVYRVIRALLIANAVSLGMLVVRFISSGTVHYWFLAWNLFLAWLPVVFAWLLRQNRHLRPFVHWTNVVYLLLWLGFLPNSFYILSDYVHLSVTNEVTLLYDVVLFGSFAINGMILGLMALLMVHEELLKRVKQQYAHAIIALVLVLCSFAIYLGRYLRWNTWDVLVNPAALLFDVSDRIINPGSYPRTFTTTIIFLVFLSSIYYVVWEIVAYLKQPYSE